MVFHLDTVLSSPTVEVPDNFFDVTVEDVQRIHEDHKKQRCVLLLLSLPLPLLLSVSSSFSLSLSASLPPSLPPSLPSVSPSFFLSPQGGIIRCSSDNADYENGSIGEEV